MIKLYNSFKIITCLALLLVGVGNAFGQGLEDFANSNATASYADNSFVGNNSITWTYVQSRDDNSDANGAGITAPALMLRRVASLSSVTSSTISGGIGDFSVKLYKGFTGAGNRQVELFVNDISQGISPAFDDNAEHVFTVNGINIGGDVVIKIANPNSGQVIIDDITWTSFTPCTAPSTQATFGAASAIGDNGLTLNPTRGDGTGGILILAKEGVAVDSEPVSGTTYTANAAFGTGEELGTGNFVVFNGSANGVSAAFAQAITSLSIGTEYHFAAFEYNTTDICYLSPAVVSSSTTTGNAIPVLLNVTTATAATTNDIILTFSESVTGSDETGLSITIDGTPATINSLAGNGTAVWTLTLAEEIKKNSGTILITYDDATGDLVDGAAADVVSFTDVAVTNNTTLNIVSDISAARALGLGADVRITGEVVVTFQRPASGDYIYIQDANAGLLIDDNGTISTVYLDFDGIINLTGTLVNGNGVMELEPLSDPGAANSSGNSVTPLIVSIADFNASVDTYESRILKFEGIGFSASGATFNAGDQFSTGSDNYTLTNGVDNLTFRDNFTEADYSSFTIPYGRLDFTVFGAEFNGTPQVIPYTSPDAFIDNYAPLFSSSPVIGNIGTGSFDVTFQSDEPGTIYYVVDQNATAPAIATILAGTSQVITTVNTDEVINITSLADNTQFYVHMVATDDEGTPNEQTVATTVDATTLEIVFDATSDIVAADAPIGTQTVLSTVNILANAVEVFNFKITDDAATDTETTSITEIVISNGNATTWSAVLGGASITDGSTVVEATTITDTDITFDVSGTPYVVTSAGELTFTLSVYLSTTQTDQTELIFTIPTNHAIVSDVAGSVIKSTLGAAVTSATHTIDVVATSFNITTPTSVAPVTDFTVTATAIDANDNTDVAARTVSLELNIGSGSLSSIAGLSSQAMTNGVYSWTDVQHDIEENITLDVTDGILTTTSSSINIFTATGGVFFSEYIEGTFDSRAFEIYNGTGASIDLSNYSVKQASGGLGFDGRTPIAAYDLQLSGTLADGDVYVVYNSAANATIVAVGDLALTYGDVDGLRNTSFTGDDALGLYENGILIDIIGDPDNDPGTAWEVAGVTEGTINHTLVRKNSITEGNTIALGSFGTDANNSEWVVSAVDDFSNIGSHIACTSPSSQASAVTFGTTDESSMIINWTQGDGDKVLVVLKESAAVDQNPISNQDYTTATSVFSDAVVDLGSGNIVVFAGNSSDQSVTVTGLASAITYHVAVYEYNSADFCYNTQSPATGSNATTASASLMVVEAITDFGSVDNGQNSVAQSFTVEGSGLTTDIVVNAPTYFEVSKDDVTYTSSVSFAHVSGSVATSTVHVRFSPTSGINTAKSGDLTIATTGANIETIAVTGTESGNTTSTFIEDFANSNATTSYADDSFLGNNGITWTYVQSRDGNADANSSGINLPALMLRRLSSGSKITSSTISGGIGNFSVKLYKGFTGANNRQVELFVNGTSYGTSTPFDDFDVHVFEVSVDVDGDVIIELVTTTEGQIIIDDIEWASFNAAASTITIDNTAYNGAFGNTTVGVTSASTSFSVTGTNLSDDVLVSAPAGFEVSLDDITFTSEVTITQSGGSVSATDVFVQFIPDAIQAYTGVITLSSAGASNKTVSVSGTGLSADAIFFEDFSNCDIVNYNTISLTGDQIWSCNSNGRTGDAARMNGFLLGTGAQDNEDWLITNAIDLSAATNASLSFYTDLGFSITDGLEVLASSDYDGSSAPSTATWTSFSPLLDQDGTFDTWVASGDIDLSAFIGGDVYLAFKYTSSTAGAAQWTIDDILIEDRTSVANPSFTITESLTDFGTVNNGAVSASQSFTVEGADLVGDVTVTAPANFEVSLDNTSFSSSVGLTPASGILASTTVHTRFAPASGINGAVSGNIVLSTTNAGNQSIAVSGTEAGNEEISNDLFFSEYLEGSSSNRAFEIFNGTGAAVDLSGYSVKQSHNGVGFGNDEFADAYDLPLSGTLADGDVYVIYNADATDATIIAAGDLALVYGDVGGARMAAFTGDDALGLFKGGVLIDVIGDPSNDPGTGWAVAGVDNATVDHTLVRKETIATGNITPLGSFGANTTGSEWIVLDLDDVSSIGSHTAANPVEPGFTLTTTDFVGDFGSLAAGQVSTTSSYSVSGTQITGDFTVTVPTGFEVSLTSDFSNKVGTSTLPLSITPANGDINAVMVFVRFAPEAAGSFSGNLVHSAAGFTSVDVAVTGEGTAVTGLDELSKYNIAVYPNPAAEILNIMIPDSFGAGEVRLSKLDGALVQKGAIGTLKQIQTSNLRSGIYLLQIKNNETVINHRVVVK